MVGMLARFAWVRMLVGSDKVGSLVQVGKTVSRLGLGYLCR